ncbi:hypothetical protein BDA99DRAFT_554926 [Phascolomyces articulosus]|uniref:Yeast cell wall synthesis Kre9/Knh1-like N-terminal domain-containing protein n=1 Tax=Phascolomyces articulosus TaxID=60185 RepID=A0AAD5KAX0_9FUNG|nr:hypothetical protein BDA99DRAFT_554926 [Phascolomyces articulosus]
MKSLAIASIAVLGLVSNAAATINILTPWQDVAWKSGGHADVTWNADGNDANQLCHIQLMNGSTDDGQIVAYVTNPEAPVPCSDTRYDIAPLNDFSSGDYWIRIGTDGRWVYSSKFHFDGKGTIDTKKLNAPVNVLLGEPAPVIAGHTSGATIPTGSSAPKPSAGGSANASGSSGAPTHMKSPAIPPTPSPSDSSGSGKSSGKSSGSTGSSSSTSSKNNNKSNVKTQENAASNTQPSGWMMAGVAALLAGVAL